MSRVQRDVIKVIGQPPGLVDQDARNSLGKGKGNPRTLEAVARGYGAGRALLAR
jgi:hypothetical protein